MPVLTTFATPLLATLASLLIGAEVPQGGTAPAPVVADCTQLDCNVGLGFAAGRLVGLGPDYKVEFAADAVVFTPVLGKAAPRELPLAYRLQAVGRAATSRSPASLVAVEPVVPQWSGTRILYDHGMVQAIYELRLDGCKQDFVFERVPAGAGDLVVRAGITSELRGVVRGDRAEFLLDDCGGVTIGAVVGIDASGRRCAGTRRLDGDVLEFTLPAAFVDSATVPLVVDPLIGGSVALSGGSNDAAPALAFDHTTGTYLAVWVRWLSATSSDVRGQRLDTAGNLVGAVLAIETSSQVVDSVRVANVNARDAFVVAWNVDQNWLTGTGDVWGRAVAAGTGALGPSVAIANGSAIEYMSHLSDAIGSGGSDEVIGVVLDLAAGQTVRRIRCNASLSLQLPPVVTSDPWGVSVVSRSAGDDRVRLLVNATTNFGVDQWGATLLDGLTNRISTGASGPLLPGVNYYVVGCDGDGSRWIVVFENEESSANSNHNLVAISVRRDGGAGLTFGNPLVIANQAGVDERFTDLVWLGNSALVGFLRGGHAYVASLDTWQCTPCEGTLTVEAAAPIAGSAGLASQLGVGGNPGPAAIVWSTTSAGVSSSYFRRFSAADGTSTDLGGGCGGGGIAVAPCPVAGNSSFRFFLSRGTPLATSFLLLSLQRLDATCGACTMIADPWNGFVIATGTTSSLGEDSYAMAIPATVGTVQLYAQWVSTGTECLNGWALSSGLLVRTN